MASMCLLFALFAGASGLGLRVDTNEVTVAQGCPTEYPYSQAAVPSYCFNSKCSGFTGNACTQPTGNPCDSWCGMKQSDLQWGSSCGTVCPSATAEAATPVNVALLCGSGSEACTATQSNTPYGSHSASKALDGNSATGWSSTCTHTSPDDAPSWWKVDLGQVRSIRSVKVVGTSHSELYAKLNAGFTIRVGSDNDYSKNAACATDVAGLSSYTKTVDCIADGQYVSIQISNGALALCEVEVMGVAVTSDASTGEYCVKVVTGGLHGHDGTINLAVDQGSGYEWVVSTSSVFAKNSIVHESCYSSVTGIRVKNPTNNAWAGVLEFSTDGGATYDPVSCTDCDAGSSSSSLLLDGNDDAALAGATKCVNGKTCTFRISTTALFPAKREVNGRTYQKFWWYDTGATWPAGKTDVLGDAYGTCEANDAVCFQRIPSTSVEAGARLLAVDSLGNEVEWTFNAGNAVAHAVWLALFEGQTTSYRVVGDAWNPTLLKGAMTTDTQDTFMYRDQNGIRSFMLDDDSCDCKTTLSMGKGMCGESCSDTYGSCSTQGVDDLDDTTECSAPVQSKGLALYIYTETEFISTTMTTTDACADLNVAENNNCKAHVDWAYTTGKSSEDAPLWYRKIGTVAGVTYQAASLGDFQRLWYCNNGNSACGNPPCSCTNPPCYTCPAAEVCVKVTTGAEDWNDGSINVAVDTGSGYEWLVSTSSLFAKESIVHVACYGSVEGIQVKNPTNNAWTGSIELSTDGGSSYSPVSCEDCDTGSDSSSVVVDGDDSGGAQAGTSCMSGNTCTFVSLYESSGSVGYCREGLNSAIWSAQTTGKKADCQKACTDLGTSCIGFSYDAGRKLCMTCPSIEMTDTGATSTWETFAQTTASTSSQATTTEYIVPTLTDWTGNPGCKYGDVDAATMVLDDDADTQWNGHPCRHSTWFMAFDFGEEVTLVAVEGRYGTPTHTPDSLRISTCSSGGSTSSDPAGCTLVAGTTCPIDSENTGYQSCSLGGGGAASRYFKLEWDGWGDSGTYQSVIRDFKFQVRSEASSSSSGSGACPDQTYSGSSCDDCPEGSERDLDLAPTGHSSGTTLRCVAPADALKVEGNRMCYCHGNLPSGNCNRFSEWEKTPSTGQNAGVNFEYVVQPASCASQASAAKGDPHLMNVKGEAFDVMQTGNMMLLEIPRGSSPATLDLALHADIERLGVVTCGPTFITSASITGRWIGVPLEIRSGPIAKKGRHQPKHTFGIRFDGRDWLPHVATQRTIELSKDAKLRAPDRMFLFQVRGLEIAVSQPKRPRIFLDIQVKGLGNLETEIGGLLGIDDHSSVEELPSGCDMPASSLALGAMEEDEALQ